MSRVIAAPPAQTFADPVADAWGEGLQATPLSAYHGLPIPERRWLVQGLLPLNNVTMLSGDGGLGKSLISQQLGTAVTLGKDWLSFPTMKRRVFAVYCEDDGDELLIRQDAINRAYSCELPTG